MPVNVTYPGVYVEEIPSGPHTIAGVSTSTTAFIGRTKWGPVEEPAIVSSFGEFQNLFGGLWKESNLGYSVMDYFNNGGQQAVIVRLFKEPAADNSPSSKSELTIGDIPFEASDPGVWGNGLSIEIDFDVTKQIADKYKLDVDKMFNLTVVKHDEKGNALHSEHFTNVTIEDKQTKEYENSLRLDLVLGQQSELLRLKEGAQLPSDLKSTKALIQDGSIKFSVKESISELKSKLSKLNDKQKDEKKELHEKINALSTSDGDQLDADCFIGPDKEQNSRGIYALDNIAPDTFNILVIPPYNPTDVDADVIEKAAEYCERKKAFMIVDPPSTWKTAGDARSSLSNIGTSSKNAAIYFPRIIKPDPLDNYKSKEFSPSGLIAGIYAATDAAQGVWKAPAGVEAVIQGAEVSLRITDDDNELLNPEGINCLRSFPVYGNVVWGARTLEGAEIMNSEWKYVPVRRLALYIEHSLYNGTKWAVFEPNDEPLWSSLIQNVGSFLNGLFASGAFAGSSNQDSFFVKVDSTTTTQNDIDQGIVNIEVGFAPVKPAEFIIIRIQQKAPQTP